MSKDDFKLKISKLKIKLTGLYLRLVLGKRTVVYRAHIKGDIIVYNGSSNWIFSNKFDSIKDSK